MTPPHDYVSTACLHGRHTDCRRRCKYCDALCQHPVHQGQPQGDMVDVERAILVAAWERLHRRDPAAAADTLANLADRASRL